MGSSSGRYMTSKSFWHNENKSCTASRFRSLVPILSEVIMSVNRACSGMMRKSAWTRSVSIDLSKVAVPPDSIVFLYRSLSQSSFHVSRAAHLDELRCILNWWFACYISSEEAPCALRWQRRRWSSLILGSSNKPIALFNGSLWGSPGARLMLTLRSFAMWSVRASSLRKAACPSTEETFEIYARPNMSELACPRIWFLSEAVARSMSY